MGSLFGLGPGRWVAEVRDFVLVVTSYFVMPVVIEKFFFLPYVFQHAAHSHILVVNLWIPVLSHGELECFGTFLKRNL